MREPIYFIASLAGAVVIGAVQVLFPVPTFWRWVLGIAGVIFVLCAAWLLVDFLTERGLGMGIVNLPVWLRGLIGAVFGAAILIGVTSMHSKAQSPGMTGPAAMTIENGGGGVGADITATGTVGQPAVTGMEINAQSGTGLRVIQNGPGVGMKVTVGGNGPATGVRVNVGGPPK